MSKMMKLALSIFLVGLSAIGLSSCGKKAPPAVVAQTAPLRDQMMYVAIEREEKLVPSGPDCYKKVVTFHVYNWSRVKYETLAGGGEIQTEAPIDYSGATRDEALKKFFASKDNRYDSDSSLSVSYGR